MAFEASVRVVALESRGGVECDGPNWGVRVDAFAAWLRELVSRPVLSDSVACAADTTACAGQTAATCRGGWWRTRDCAALGASCGSLGPAVGLGCLPVACGSVDAKGQCREGRALRCGGGQVAQVDCVARDQGCVIDPAAGAQCVACAEFLTDARRCGACGARCAFPHGASSCEAGVCVVTGCDEGFVWQGGACVGAPVEAEGPSAAASSLRAGLGCQVVDGEVALVAWGLAVGARTRRRRFAGAKGVSPS